MKQVDTETLLGEFSEALDARAAVNRVMGLEYDFAAELDQYREQRPAEAGDSARRIQPTTQSIYRKCRYKASFVRQHAPLNYYLEPRDEMGDADSARAMKEYLEWETVGKRWKRYEDVRARAIESMILMRAGCFRLEWRPDIGRFGEILPRLVDPRMVLFPAPYLEPHDPLNPRLYEIFRMPVAQAKAQRGWNTDQLEPDGGNFDIGGILAGRSGNRDSFTAVNFQSRGDSSGPQQSVHGDVFTGVMIWMRHELGYVPPPRKLTAPEQYLQCPQCGWKTIAAGDHPEYDAGFKWSPFEAGMACEQCGQQGLPRVSEEELDPEAKRASKGKRLVILPLNGSQREPLWDRGWPVPTARSFPYWWCTPYLSSQKPLPKSDVSFDVSVVTGANFTLRCAYEQAHRARGIQLLPERGLTDRNGARYDMGDDQDDVVFYNPQDARGHKPEYIEGPTVAPALFQLYQVLSGEQRANEGTSDLPMPAERSRDIPVGTVTELKETGNVPLDDLVARVFDADSIAAGVMVDLIRYTKTVQEAVRGYGPRGELVFNLIRGMDLPDMDASVGSGPSLSRVNIEDFQKFSQLSAMHPADRIVVGRMLGVHQDLLRQLDEADRQKAESMIQNPMAAVVPPVPTNGNGNGSKPPNRVARFQ